MVLQTVHSGRATYELRYNRCGKANCTRCNATAASNYGQPGHGPYWYLVFTHLHRTFRCYVGKSLDTSRFRHPDGSLDYDTLFSPHKER